MNITKEKKINRKEKRFIYDSENIKISNEYLEYLKTKELAERTIYHSYRSIIVVLSYFEKNNLKIKSLSNEDIEKYIKSLKDLSVHTKKNILKHLRCFLRFLYQKGYIENNLAVFIPSISVPSYNHIPDIIEEKDIVKIFSVIDRNTKSGKFMYAILILATKYGLRIGDIKNLKFENIQWKTNKIKFIQSKTNNELELPLLKDVADGLIDYIKNCRNESKENYIFINKNEGKYKTSNFYKEFNILMEKANVVLSENQKKGINLLRHSFASRLLKKNIPLGIISPILGHTSQMTSMNYIKIDNNNLIKCCLEIQNEKN